MKLGRISGHARQRMKRLGLSETSLRGLLEQGRVVRDGAGGMRVFGPQAASHGARADGIYAVLDAEGEVITVGGAANAARH